LTTSDNYLGHKSSKITEIECFWQSVEQVREYDDHDEERTYIAYYGPSIGAALSVAARPSVCLSVRPSCASDFLETEEL